LGKSNVGGGGAKSLWAEQMMQMENNFCSASARWINFDLQNKLSAAYGVCVCGKSLLGIPIHRCKKTKPFQAFGKIVLV
jgi:hypothetical protein